MKILAALDVADEAQDVLEKAVAVAKQQGGELTLISVAENFTTYADYMESARLGEKLLEQAQKGVAQARERAKAMGVEAKTAVQAAESPADSIAEYATEGGFDLIVMGHRNKTGLDRFLVGSVASRVVAQAPCSVLVVR